MHTLDLQKARGARHALYPKRPQLHCASPRHVGVHQPYAGPTCRLLVPVSAPSCSKHYAAVTPVYQYQLPTQTIQKPQTFCKQHPHGKHLSGHVGSQEKLQSRCQAFGGGGSTPPGNDSKEGPSQGWQLLEIQQYNFKWDVPWGVGTTTAGMLLWFVTFFAVPVLSMAAVLSAGYVAFEAGAPSIKMPDPATFLLATTALQTLVGLAVIKSVTAGPLGKQAATNDSETQLFNYSRKDPLTPPHGWLFWSAIGLILTRVVVEGTSYVVELTGYDNMFAISSSVQGMLPFIKLDLRTYLSLLAASGVLAPILEETVFRGFLLPSLCKSMPNWAAVGLSSLMFGAAHFADRDLPVLVAEGCVLGFMYIRSRNLLTPIIIHGVWNSSVLMLLFALVAGGVDLTSSS